MNITNIKLHTRICNHLLSGFINVTGIKTRLKIEEALKVLQTHFELDSSDLEQYVIDNISSQYTGNLHSLRNRNLSALAREGASLKHTIKVKYNREKFPGLFLKTDHGTLICFSSPAIVAVGSKNDEDLRKLRQLIEQLLLPAHNAISVL